MENREKIEIGKNIASLRKKMGLSQADFAERINVVASTLCRWETGKTAPPMESIEIICQEFNVTQKELIFGKEATAEINKKGGRILKLLIPFVVIAIIVALLWLFFPRYRVADVSDAHPDTYGQTVTYKVVLMPTFEFEHESADEYAKKIKGSYMDRDDIDAIEIYFFLSDDEINDINGAHECFYFIF